jgi:hypothetical protein
LRQSYFRDSQEYVITYNKKPTIKELKIDV